VCVLCYPPITTKLICVPQAYIRRYHVLTVTFKAEEFRAGILYTVRVSIGTFENL
jgi:hypothetical protein